MNSVSNIRLSKPATSRTTYAGLAVASLGDGQRRRLIAALRLACRCLGMGRRGRIGALGVGSSIVSLLATWAFIAVASLGGVIVASPSLAQAVCVTNPATGASTGTGSFACGPGATTDNGTNATTYSTAVGIDAKTTGNFGTSIGNFAGVLNGGGVGNTAIGTAANTYTLSNPVNFTTAIGSGSVDAQGVGRSGAAALGNNAIAIGGGDGTSGVPAVTGFGQGNIAIGSNSGAGATVLSDGSIAPQVGTGLTALGFGAQAGTTGGNNATAIGSGAIANVANGTALGQGASATAANSVALGRGSVANQANTVSVGNAGAERRIVNVANGTANTDAVNVSQLNAAIAAAPGAPFVANNSVTTAAPTAAGQDAAAGGYRATASGRQATAVGNLSSATMVNASAYGFNAQATSANSSAFGAGATATGGAGGASAFGQGAQATSDNATALGVQSIASGGASIAIGLGGAASGVNSIAIGRGSRATLDTSVAIGSGSTTTAASSIDGNAALGIRNNAGAVAAGTGSVVSVGSAGNERQIQNVAAGAVTQTSTAAVNGSQLFSVATNVNNVGAGTATALGGGAAYNTATGAFTGPNYTFGSGAQFNNVGSALGNLDTRTTANSNSITALQNGQSGLVQQANTTAPITVGASTGGTVVNVAGTAGNRQITGVAAGNIASAASTDAVNGGQLFATNQQVATNTTNLSTLGNTTAAAIGGGATYNPATGVTGVSYQLNGSSTTFTNVVAGQQALANGAAGPVQYATPGTPSNALNLVGTGGAVTLGNVAAGNLSATSTQAVNGSQLFATNQAVAGLQNGTTGLVQQDPTTRTITVGANTNGNLVNVAGTAGNRQITGVAAGNLAAGSTDAVNGGQLFATNQQVATNTANIATNSKGISDLQTGQTGVFRANNAGGAAAPQASGANAVAGGYGAVASGGSTTAVGTGAQASQFGATAIGAGAVASGDPTTAVGFNAQATGAEASAFGAFAVASADNSTALGRSATAAGANSVAVGFGSSAAQANSVAIGAGVATTRANQVAIGNAGQTYTLAGINSAQSLAAQTGTTGFVTTDAAGNLASAGFGPGNISALDGRVTSLEGRVSNLEANVGMLRRDVRSAFQGTAIALALGGAVLPAGKNYAVSGNFGTYHGSTAVGFTGIARISDNLYASGGVGFGVDGRSNVGGRGGLTYAW